MEERGFGSNRNKVNFEFETEIRCEIWDRRVCVLNVEEKVEFEQMSVVFVTY
jgi:hypothetical protein